MTNEEAKNIAKKIMSSLELTPDMENDLKSLVDSIDERQGVEDEGKNKRIEELEKEVERQKQKYIDRFFNGTEDDVKEKTEEIKKETKEDVDRDGEVQSFEELFEKREG